MCRRGRYQGASLEWIRITMARDCTGAFEESGPVTVKSWLTAMVAQRKRKRSKNKPVSTSAAELFLNRELSLLAFNERVLAMATRDSVPLAERLRYVCIVSSNLDEFFEVRVSDLAEGPGVGVRTGAGTSYARVLECAHRLVERQYELYNKTLMPALARKDIVIVNHAQRTAEQRAWVADYFRREVKPLLAPIGLDPSHPFPQVLNKSLNFIMQLEGKDAFGRPSAIAILKVPRVLPRVIPLPAKIASGKQAFVMLTSAIRAHLQELFPAARLSVSLSFA
jgi:polyphosphate kinase